MKIYLIAGKAESGKTTFATLLREELKEYGYKPCIMHITEPLYQYAKNYFEWNENKNEKPREFLQKMGIEIIQQKLNKKNFLLNRLFEDIEILDNFFDTFIICDIRLINELESINKKYNDVISIKIERNNHNNRLTEEEKNHITEKEIDKYNKYDYIIKNEKLDELKEQAQELIRNEETYER